MDANNHWGDTGGGQHPPPWRILAANDCNILKCDGDNETQHDSESGPHLPHHGEGSTDGLWRRFGSVDRRSRGLCADSESKHEARDKEVWPYRSRQLSVHTSFGESLLTALSGRHPDTGDERDDARDEDGSTAAKELVQGCVGPASDETRAKVRSPVKQTSKPHLVLCNSEFSEVESLDKMLVAGNDKMGTAKQLT